ncbi:MAG TPA: cob(I)yrinic acid a,c-diamide adenosyltransferase [Syntrophales bacterium]|nr:cob(I)yrinic acid a,c-diamide adenosyltransferase [Syntrophales bacterium]
MKMKDKGRVILFTGDGKGKTTAALGMVLRASGHGMKSLVIQFVKSDTDTGELAACRQIAGVEIVQAGRGFVPERADPLFQKHRQAAEQGMELAERALLSGGYDLVILDEICIAVWKGLLDDKRIIDVVLEGVPGTCVVMTGRNATTGIISLADTVTEMRMVKHGFSNGFEAQKGVEY